MFSSYNREALSKIEKTAELCFLNATNQHRSFFLSIASCFSSSPFSPTYSSASSHFPSVSGITCGKWGIAGCLQKWWQRRNEWTVDHPRERCPCWAQRGMWHVQGHARCMMDAIRASKINACGVRLIVVVCQWMRIWSASHMDSVSHGLPLQIQSAINMLVNLVSVLI